MKVLVRVEDSNFRDLHATTSVNFSSLLSPTRLYARTASIAWRVLILINCSSIISTLNNRVAAVARNQWFERNPLNPAALQRREAVSNNVFKYSSLGPLPTLRRTVQLFHKSASETNPSTSCDAETNSSSEISLNVQLSAENIITSECTEHAVSGHN